MATATPSKAADSGTPAKVPPLGRVMVWIGLAAGTAVTVLAVTHGIRIPGLQVVLSVLATWVLLTVLAVTVAELARRHHRAAARHAWRHGKRAARFAGHHTGRGASGVTRKAAERWQRRQHRPPASDPLPPYVTGGPAPRMRPETTAPRVPGDAEGAPVPQSAAYSYGRAGVRAAWPMSSAAEAHRRARAASASSDHTYVVTEYPPGGPGKTIAAYKNGNPTEGTPIMTDTKIVNDGTKAGRQPGGRIRPARRAQHTAAQAGGAVPAEWGGVIARAADFEPDDDGELLGWMGDEVSGVAGYAEALVDLYESCTAGIGLDPVAMTALHDVADAAAHAAETMSGARRRFADHYELPREFAGNGGLMPHDGRWVTGDGDA